MELIDTHTHLYLEEFGDDLPLVVERAREAGVVHACLPNIDCSTVAPMLALCDQYPDLFSPMIGLHPTSVDAGYKGELSVLEELLSTAPQRFIAIGEVGIDLYWDQSFRNEQSAAFETQINWALQYDLPLIIHCREAFSEIFAILNNYQSTPLRGIFHSFTGGEQEVRQILRFDRFLIGINGIVTFKKSSLPALLPEVPLARIVAETDSPYLAPVPCRGKRNETAYIKHTVARMAEIYNLPTEEMARITTKNARQLFHFAQ
jgi:TatD DNase family protein